MDGIWMHIKPQNEHIKYLSLCLPFFLFVHVYFACSVYLCIYNFLFAMSIDQCTSTSLCLCVFISLLCVYHYSLLSMSSSLYVFCLCLSLLLGTKVSSQSFGKNNFKHIWIYCQCNVNSDKAV